MSLSCCPSLSTLSEVSHEFEKQSGIHFPIISLSLSYYRWRNHHQSVTIQLFPRGCIQILGHHPDRVYDTVRSFLVHHLSPVTLSSPIIKSMTVILPWTNSLDLRSLPSNARISNEREIFPATLVSHPLRIHHREHHYHCALFPNGTAIVTGVTSIPEAHHVLSNVVNDLHTK